MKIIITGSNGMLGWALTKLLTSYNHSYEIFAFDRRQMDITNPQMINKRLKAIMPDLVINCAAYTDVDGAEAEKDLACRVNGEGPLHLLRAAKACGAKLVHISSDYVFNGASSSPYDENAAISPASAYGYSKALGEENLMKEGGDFLIIRTSWLFGPNGKNFVTTIANLLKSRKEIQVVDDQTGSPTYTIHLSRAILSLIEMTEFHSLNGILHVTNRGQCSWFEFACEILRLLKYNSNIVPIKTEKLSRPAKRPLFSVLSTKKYNTIASYKMPHWKEALKEYLQV